MDKEILVIANRQDVLQTIRDMLEGIGYYSQGCLGGNFAWEALEAGLFAFVIADVELHNDVDGLLLARKIREDEKLANMPIILMSSDSSYKEEALDAGADLFLTKPIHIEMLQEAVQALFAKRTH